jgi:hypothetical protein
LCNDHAKLREKQQQKKLQTTMDSRKMNAEVGVAGLLVLLL